MLISLKTFIGKTFTLEVESSDTIYEVKVKLQEKEGIPTNKQRLFLRWDELELENNRPLIDYNIQDEPVIYLALKIDNNLQIFVKTVNGLYLILHVESSVEIYLVKRKIQENKGIPVKSQKLTAKVRRLDDDETKVQELEDSQTLGDYNIETGSTIYLFLRNIPCYIKIFVKPLLYDAFMIEVDSLHTIEHVKRIIWYKKRIHPDRQCLTFGGKRLEDGQTLKDYGIEKESMLHLVMIR